MDNLIGRGSGSVHLSGASLLRPIFARTSSIAGLFTVVSAATTVPSVSASHSCPYIEAKHMWESGFDYGSWFQGIQSWWRDDRFPGSSVSANMELPRSTISEVQPAKSWWSDFSLKQSANSSVAPTVEDSSSFGRIRSWWQDFGFSKSTSSVDVQSDSSWSSFHFWETSTENNRFDYVRLVQLIISIVGIGLSLRLMLYLVEQINPTAKEKRISRKRAHQLFAQMGLKSVPPLTDYEVGIAVSLVDPRVLATDWDSIGGLDGVIEDLLESVIIPFDQLQLIPNFQSRLLRPPKGVLLFGPPGCGKTMLARAMARAARASFINLQISNLVNMWYGETQKYVEATFSLAHKLQPSILFIDELDSFLTTRSCTDNESTRMLKTQFMALWDGLLTEEHTRILVVGATNRPEDLDQAILRRLPYKVAIPLPNLEQRVQILTICLRDEPLASELTGDHIREIASKTENLSGSDLTELCREAAFCCYRAERSRSDAKDMRLKPNHFFEALQKFLRNRVSV